MKPPEHQIRCNPPHQGIGGDERLRFTLDGVDKSVDLRIGALSKSLVASLPDHVTDLIEIASLVYAIDASVSRGGLADSNMGVNWHRRFNVEIPVRCMDIWARESIQQGLEETLMFLSGDRFSFNFTKNNEPVGASSYFQFGNDSGWCPDSVVMFSGGLDSFAGVLEEIIERNNKVALISHHSSTKIAKVQRDLQKAIGEKVGAEKLMHIPVTVQLKAGTNKEGSHRTRSFLFAALGIANTIAFGRDKVSFYENGIVSLNLPPVTNAVGTRATRTTHPQTLARFTKLFSQIFGTPLRVENPYFWRTKKEVVEAIRKFGFVEAIAHTRSCADVHNLTKQYSHCGRCSQCIDRRFAMIAAGLERYDPEEAYRIDLMSGERLRAVDREVALSYVRCAVAYESLSYVELEQRFPELNRVVAHLGEPDETALKRLSELLRRHGEGVSAVMQSTISGRPMDDFAPNTLPRMFGDFQQERLDVSLDSRSVAGDQRVEEMLELHFDAKGKSLTINGVIEVKGATCNLLFTLAQEHLGGAGRGLQLEDYPTSTAEKLSKVLKLASAESVRKRVNRSRAILRRKFVSAGLEGEQGEALIENLAWSGYRLTPDRVKVLVG